MTNNFNIGNAILIVGLVYLNLAYPNVTWLQWFSIVTIFIAMGSWTFIYRDDTTKKRANLENEKLESEIELNKAETASYQIDPNTIHGLANTPCPCCGEDYANHEG